MAEYGSTPPNVHLRRTAMGETDGRKIQYPPMMRAACSCGWRSQHKRHIGDEKAMAQDYLVHTRYAAAHGRGRRKLAHDLDIGSTVHVKRGDGTKWVIVGSGRDTRTPGSDTFTIQSLGRGLPIVAPNVPADMLVLDHRPHTSERERFLREGGPSAPILAGGPFRRKRRATAGRTASRSARRAGRR